MNVSLSAPDNADPGLQLASPQNNLVSHWGVHPSRWMLGSHESKSGHGHVQTSLAATRRRLADAREEFADNRVWRIYWGTPGSVGREMRDAEEPGASFGVGCRVR